MSTFDEAVVDIKNARDVVDGLVANQNPETTEMKHPDPKKHLYISLAKSFIRITAGVCLVVGFPVWCGIGLIAAEALGIIEELV
jgi:hypothetical protein